jgi:phosphoribosylanthranilate isomerase
VAGRGIRIVRAIRVPPGPDGAADPGRWHDLALRFAAAGADEILFDSASARRPGGSGERFDWGAVRQAVAARPRPVVLAGGLTPVNVAEAIRAVRPDGVDVISGVEDARHRKDPALVRAFVRAVRLSGGA